MFLSSGTLDEHGWVSTRLLACVGQLVQLPELRGRPGGNVQDIGVSIVAHWALETQWGEREYNYNLGGIHAFPGVPFFRSTDAGVPTKFQAWTSLNDGVRGYIDLLRNHFGACWQMLIAFPPYPWSQWFDCLGAHGYYALRGNYEAARIHVLELLSPGK